MTDIINLSDMLIFGIFGVIALIAFGLLVVIPLQNNHIIRQAKAEAEKDSQRRQQRMNETH